MIIDSHVHLWVQDPNHYPWNPIGGYIPESDASLPGFMEIIKNAGVERAVLVQPTPYGWDNAYLLDIKKEHGEFRAVVLVDPFSEHAGIELESLKQKGADGLRVNLHLNPPAIIDNPFFLKLMDAADALELPVCFQLTPLYFGVIRDLAENHPGMKIILDHLARPEKGIGVNGAPFHELFDLADYPNIFIKLSGLNYYSKESAPYKDCWQYLALVNEHFSAQRCMWGSDYPLVEEHWNYKDNLATYQNKMGFPQEDLVWILGKTALGIWWKEQK